MRIVKTASAAGAALAGMLTLAACHAEDNVAVVNGVPSRIVDVSAEGLRLEMSREWRTALPPYFTVRVPAVGVAMTVQRMWTQTPSTKQSSVWYGSALSNNRVSIHQAWRAFVDTVPVVNAHKPLVIP